MEAAMSERESIEDNIRAARYFGAKAVFVHGGTVDRYWREEKREKIRDVLAFIKDQGLPAGMASHDPERLMAADEEDYGADFYLSCMYNISGRMGKILALEVWISSLDLQRVLQ